LMIDKLGTKVRFNEIYMIFNNVIISEKVPVKQKSC
jgi:hypothetical protein